MATADLPLSRPLAGVHLGRRAAWQRAVGLAAWALFGAGWGRVVARGVPASLPVRDGLLIAGLLLAIAAATGLWVRHNRAVYRRKGPRRAVPRSPGHPAHDRLGRVLHAHVDGVRGAREVVVTLGPGTKLYEPITAGPRARDHGGVRLEQRSVGVLR